MARTGSKAPRWLQVSLPRGPFVTALATLLSTCVLPSEPRTHRIQFVLPSDTVLVATGGTVAPQIGVLVDGKPISDARIRLESGDSSLATIVEPNRILGRKRGTDAIRVALVSGASGASPPETSFVAHVIVRAMRPALSDTARGRAILFAFGDSVLFRPGYLAADSTPLSPSDSAAITPRYDLAVGGFSGRAIRLDPASGKIIAVANGTDTIRAAVDTAHAYLVVTVRQRAVRVQVSPDTVAFSSLTQTRQLAVAAYDRRDSLIAQPAVAWSSTKPGVVAMGSGSGLATAVANGTAGVTATVDSASAAASVTVRQVAAKLAFTVQPNRTVAGGLISPAVQVTVQDSLGIPVANAATLITLAIGTNPGGGTLAGTVSRSAVNGVATFSDLSIATAGAGYTLVAGANGLVAATSTGFDIDPGAAAKVTFLVQPTPTVAGNTIGPAVQVAIQDALGNTVPSATGTITLAIGTNPGAGTLQGTLVRTPVGGVASFTDLSVNKAGSGYTLVATAGGLASGTSTGFAITPAVPSKLAFTVQPTKAVAGSALTPAVQVAIQDGLGNTVSSATGIISLTIGTNPGGAMLTGAVTQTAVSGIASFPNLSLNKTGMGYTIVATASGMTGATSAGFDITAGAPTKLAFTVQPTPTVVGTALTPAVQVAIQDGFGNTVPSATGLITVALGTNPSGGTLAGTLSRSAVNGVASFADLTINKVGTGYKSRVRYHRSRHQARVHRAAQRHSRRRPDHARRAGHRRGRSGQHGHDRDNSGHGGDRRQPRSRDPRRDGEPERGERSRHLLRLGHQPGGQRLHARRHGRRPGERHEHRVRHHARDSHEARLPRAADRHGRGQQHDSERPGRGPGRLRQHRHELYRKHHGRDRPGEREPGRRALRHHDEAGSRWCRGLLRPEHQQIGHRLCAERGHVGPVSDHQ